MAAVVGSRLLYVVFHLDQYSNPLDMFALWQGGATFYGGFILAIAASYWWVHKHKIPFLQIADIMAPSIGLGPRVHAHRLLPLRLLLRKADHAFVGRGVPARFARRRRGHGSWRKSGASITWHSIPPSSIRRSRG